MPPLLGQPSLCLVRSSPIHSSDCFSSSNSLPRVVRANRCGVDLGKLEIWKANDFIEAVYREEAANELIRSVPMFRISYHWIATLNQNLLPIKDDFNLSAVVKDLNSIQLPPFVTLPHSIITNISMSSSSPEDEDCVVALKFMGPQLSFCRPSRRRDSEWINVRIQNPCFYSSHVMFSKKHEMFCIPASGGHMIGSWDLHDHNKKPKLQRLRFKNLPVLTKAQQRLMTSCCTTEHLVESPAGETFMFKLYRKPCRTNIKGDMQMKTVALMVFKIDDKGNAVYTRDTQDLRILISMSEPFGVSVSSCRGNFQCFVDVTNFVAFASIWHSNENACWN